MDTKTLLEEMLEAIKANIEFLKTSGNSQIRIKNGKFLYSIDDNFIYEFQLDYLQEIDPEADIEVRIFNRTYSGKVSALKENIIEIALDQHLGDSVASATLIISNYYLLERLHEHLDSLKGSKKETLALLEKTFGIQDPHIADDSSYKPLPEDSLNEYQSQAISTVLGSDVTFIWGPPGTGKSATIAKLFRELVDRGKSILLIAHTNAATDSVLKEVIAVMRNHNAYKEGRIIRIGSAKVIDDEIKNTMVMPEVVVEEKAKPLTEEVNRLKSELDEIGVQLKKIDELKNVRDLLHDALARQTQYIASMQKTEQEYHDYKERINRMDEISAKIEVSIAEFQSKNRFYQLISGTSLDKLTEQKSQALRAASSLRANLNICVDRHVAIKTEFDKCTKQITEAETFLEGSNINFDDAEVKRLKKRSSDLSDQIEALNKKISELEEMLIVDAQVIVTTLTKTYMHKRILGRDFDVVILDEASMAPLPAIASATAAAKEKVVLVGDFLQLPPIAQHKVDPTNKTEEEANYEQHLVDNWLRRDIFNMSGIDKDVESGRDVAKGWMRQLKIQYRMHPDISFFVNNLVYAKNGNEKYALENGDSTHLNGSDTLEQEPLKGAHIGLYDTSTLGTMPIKTESGSTYNLTHALIAVNLAKQAIDNGAGSVGIISSYRAQVNLINKIIHDEGRDYKSHIVADTVHRFQGGAKDLIIFDVSTPQTNTMYDDLKEGGDDAKLINVAISRAKNKFIYLVDKSAVLKKHSESSLIRKSIEIIEDKNYPIVDANVVLDSFSADDRAEHWLEKLQGVKDIEREISQSCLFDERDFYSYFQKDLLSAKYEVLIQSAFLTVARINHLLPIFKHVQSKGVRIFVMTRAAHEQSGNMIEQSEKGLRLLESNGIFVLPLPGKVHQKFGIIDRAIMWEGSLNILSQRDSSETMRRITGSATVKQFMEFHRLEKNLGELGSSSLAHCEVCREPGSYYWTGKSRFGLWTFCLTGKHMPGKPPKSKADTLKYQKEKADKQEKAARLRKLITLNASGKPICPEHHRIMLDKTGRFGEYWECALVKDCGCRANRKQLAHLGL